MIAHETFVDQPGIGRLLALALRGVRRGRSSRGSTYTVDDRAGHGPGMLSSPGTLITARFAFRGTVGSLTFHVGVLSR